MDPANGKSVKFDNKDTLDLQGAKVNSLAIVGDTAFYTENKKNRIGVIDLTKGTMLADITVLAPQGICKFNDNTILVCSEKQIISIDIKTGIQTPFLKDLADPAAVTLDAKGNIYVSELGTLQ